MTTKQQQAPPPPPTTTTTTHYATLGVAESADTSEVKRAYRRRAMDLHPDKNGNDPVKEMEMKAVNEAYRVLSDPTLRAQYDQNMHMQRVFGRPHQQQQQQHPPHTNNSSPFPFANSPLFGDMFNAFFMHGFHGHSHQQDGGDDNDDDDNETLQRNPTPAARDASRDSDVKVDVYLSAQDIVRGTEKMVVLEMRDRCSSCGGKGCKPGCAHATCKPCMGRGAVRISLPPLVMEKTCASCAGRGKTLPVRARCETCGGDGTVFRKRKYVLSIPQHVAHNSRIVHEGRGAYCGGADNEDGPTYGNLVVCLRHMISEPYAACAWDPASLLMHVSLTLSELLYGFQKRVDVVGQTVNLSSSGYFNPNRLACKLTNCGIAPGGSLYILFKVQFEDTVKSLHHMKDTHEDSPDDSSNNDNSNAADPCCSSDDVISVSVQDHLADVVGVKS